MSTIFYVLFQKYDDDYILLHIQYVIPIYNVCEYVLTDHICMDLFTDDIIIESGEPVQIILETADQQNCDLIVMGSHGHGGFVNTLIGSIARRVVRQSKKPVLVVKLPD